MLSCVFMCLFSLVTSSFYFCILSLLFIIFQGFCLSVLHHSTFCISFSFPTIFNLFLILIFYASFSLFFVYIVSPLIFLVSLSKWVMLHLSCYLSFIPIFLFYIPHPVWPFVSLFFSPFPRITFIPFTILLFFPFKSCALIFLHACFCLQVIFSTLPVCVRVSRHSLFPLETRFPYFCASWLLLYSCFFHFNITSLHFFPLFCGFIFLRWVSLFSLPE